MWYCGVGRALGQGNDVRPAGKDAHFLEGVDESKEREKKKEPKRSRNAYIHM